MGLLKALLSKGWLASVALTVGMSVAGGSYAAWTSSLEIEGTIQTGDVDVLWEALEIDQFIGIRNPQTGVIVFRPVTPNDDIAECDSNLNPGETARTISFFIDNGFSAYVCRLTIGALITGSVPMHVAKIARSAEDQAGNNVLDSAIKLDVKMTRQVAGPGSLNGRACNANLPVVIGTQLHRGDRICVVIDIQITEQAQPSHIYKGAVSIEFAQWNLAG